MSFFLSFSSLVTALADFLWSVFGSIYMYKREQLQPFLSALPPSLPSFLTSSLYYENNEKEGKKRAGARAGGTEGGREEGM